MQSVICPPTNEYGEILKWTFTQPLGTCIYNVYDETSFIIGWLSVLSWSLALLPQIITNCKNKSAESQSFWFWILWLFGDFCNFSGCILTKNLITNIALAFVYLAFTSFACWQFIWYEYYTKKWRKQRVIIDRIHDTINQNPQFILPKNGFANQTTNHKQMQIAITDDDKERSSLQKATRATKQSGLGTRIGLWKTPKFARKYSLLGGVNGAGNCAFLSPQLTKTLKMVQRSPRMFSIQPQLTDKMRDEYQQMLKWKKEQEQLMMAQYGIVNGECVNDVVLSDDDSDSGSDSSDSYLSDRDPATSTATPTTMKIYTNNNQGSGGGSSINESKDADERSLLRGGIIHKSRSYGMLSNRNYGSVSTVLSTLSSMSMTIVMFVCLWNNANNDSELHRTRHLLAESSGGSSNEDAKMMMSGMVLGWVSAFIYISSRIPQLKLMMESKDVNGLNPAFFCLTFSGNVTQFLSMIINRQIYQFFPDFMSKLPWIMSASVCLLQDGVIIFLIWTYSVNSINNAIKSNAIQKKNIMSSSTSRSLSNNHKQSKRHQLRILTSNRSFQKTILNTV